MEEVTRDDITREGLHQPAPLCSARPESAQRAHEYGQHMRRMELDPEYRMRWEQMEKDFQAETKDKNYYY